MCVASGIPGHEGCGPAWGWEEMPGPPGGQADLVTFLPVPSLLTGTVTVRLSLADGLGLALPLRLFGRLCRVLKHILGGGRAVSGGGGLAPRPRGVRQGAGGTASHLLVFPVHLLDEVGVLPLLPD